MRSKIRASQIDEDVFSQSVAESIAAFYLLGPVFTTGDQNISGLKTFYTVPFISGAPFIVGTGGQLIGGPKYFTTPIFTDRINSLTGNSYILINSGKLFDRNGQISLDWDKHQLTGASWHFQSQPTLSGADFVLTTGGQIIGGLKTFNNGAVFNGVTVFNDLIANLDNNSSINLIDSLVTGPDTTLKIDWSNNLLTGGNWSVITPVIPNNIVNKNYVDNGANNILRTTGDQDFDGIKTIKIGSFNGIGFEGVNDGILDSSGNFSSQGIISLDALNSLILSGNWRTNTFPTQSGNLVNLGFLTGYYTGITGITQNYLNDNGRKFNHTSISMYFDQIYTGLNFQETWVPDSITLTGLFIGAGTSGAGAIIANSGASGLLNWSPMVGNFYQRTTGNNTGLLTNFSFTSGINYQQNTLSNIQVSGLSRVGINILSGLSGISTVTFGLFGYLN